MIKKGLFIGLMMVFWSSCFTPDDIRLDEAAKNKEVQKVFEAEVKKLQPLMNKGCEENFDYLVDKAVDSLVNVYLDANKYDY